MNLKNLTDEQLAIIAKELDVPVETIKSLYTRAKSGGVGLKESHKEDATDAYSIKVKTTAEFLMLNPLRHENVLRGEPFSFKKDVTLAMTQLQADQTLAEATKAEPIEYGYVDPERDVMGHTFNWQVDFIPTAEKVIRMSAGEFKEWVATSSVEVVQAVLDQLANEYIDVAADPNVVGMHKIKEKTLKLNREVYKAVKLYDMMADMEDEDFDALEAVYKAAKDCRDDLAMTELKEAVKELLPVAATNPGASLYDQATSKKLNKPTTGGSTLQPNFYAQFSSKKLNS